MLCIYLAPLLLKCGPAISLSLSRLDWLHIFLQTPHHFIRLRVFGGSESEVLGASSNCLGRRCLAAATVTVGPRNEQMRKSRFDIFVISLSVGTAVSTFECIFNVLRTSVLKPSLDHVLCAFTNYQPLCTQTGTNIFPAGGIKSYG